MRVVLLIALAMAAAPTALAQPTSAYYGLQYGEFDYTEDDGAGSDLVADTVSSYRLMVGYQFTENMAFEGGWGQTDDVVTSFDVDFGFPVGLVPSTLTYEFEILTVRFLGVLPFENGITLLGGLGYADMDWEGTIVYGDIGSQSADLSEGDLTYYAGVQYDWERFAIRIGYEKYDLSNDFSDIDETAISFFYKL